MRNLYGKRKLKCRGAVIVLLLLMAVVFGFGRLSKLLEVKTVEASQLPELKQQVEQLDTKARVATASSSIVRLTEDQIKKILSILMPKAKDRERFMAILKCENGTHDPKRININKPGLGYDLGISQINSRFHANRVKEFFGQDFDEAMQDPIKNLVYATYLYQNSGFEPWVCNSKISMGGG